MKYQVTGFNNFCRVFQLPDSFPSGYCHGGGLPTTFKMVDWFNPVIGLPQWAISERQYNSLVEKGEITDTESHSTEVDADELQELLKDFLKEKNYVIEGATYLVICSFGMVFTFSGNKLTTN